MPHTVASTRPGPTPRVAGPRNGLGAVTFAVVLLAALLAVFPTTAGFGFLLCLLALVPAVVAYRRTRKGTATNHGRSFAAVLMAPVFLIVAVVVGASTAPARVETTSDVTALTGAGAPAAAAVAAPAPLLAAPVPAPVPAAAPVEPAAGALPSAASSAVRAAAPGSARTSSHATPSRPAPAVHAAAAPTPVLKRVAPPPAPKAAPKPSVPPAPKPAPAMKPVPAPEPETGSAPICDTATHYLNDAGHCVHNPSSTGGGSPTALCNDGTYSYSETHSGSCSRHKGVAKFL